MSEPIIRPSMSEPIIRLPSSLGYGRLRQPLRRRLKTIILGALMILLGFGCFSIRTNIETIILQHECATYKVDPSRVVYWLNSDHAAAQRLFDADPRFSPLRASARLQAREATIDVACWRRLVNLINAKSLTETLPVGSTHPLPLLFLHQRTSAIGTKRIVAIQIHLGSNTPGFLQVVTIPQTIGIPKPKVDTISEGIGPGWLNNLLNQMDCLDLRVHAGQPDNVDTSHFTIEIVTQGSMRYLEGWLQDDGTVKFATRP